MIVDGVRMDHVRRCACGRKPEISTGYVGLGIEAGYGPFIIKCYCGREGEQGEHGDAVPRFCRSWSKTRAVKLWSRMNRPQPAPAVTAPA